MKKSTGFVGDHCFYSDKGLKGLFVLEAFSTLFVLAMAIYANVSDLLVNGWVLYIMVAICAIGIVILYFRLRDRLGVRVCAEPTGVKIVKKDQLIGLYPWSSIKRIMLQERNGAKNQKVYTAYALVGTDEEPEFSFRKSLNNPKGEERASGYIILGSGDRQQASEAVRLMRQWQEEYQ